MFGGHWPFSFIRRSTPPIGTPSHSGKGNAVNSRTKMEVSYVVRDPGGHVVVIFTGIDAPDAAKEWAERGYEVTTTPLD